jgi:beta-amylase
VPQNAVDIPQAPPSDTGPAAEAKHNLLTDALAATPATASSGAHSGNLKAAAEALTKPQIAPGSPLATLGSIHPKSETDAPMSYLETGVDKAWSLVISDKDTRKTADHYSCEFLTTAALFAGGKVGLASTLVLYGLNSARPDSKAINQVEDFALGAVKGVATRGIFAGANYLPTAPLKGVVTGIGARVLDTVVNRDTFSDPSKAVHKLKTETFSGPAMLADAVTWTLGEGVFRGGNYLSGGRLAQNPIMHGMAMGASFGAVNGSNAEISREKAAGESISVTKVAEHGLIEAVIGGAAAGGGMRVSMGGPGGGGDVHVNEVKGKGDEAGAGTGSDREGQGREKQSGVTISLAELGRSVKIAGAARLGGLPDLSKYQIPELGAVEMTAATPPPKPPSQSTAREFVIDSSKHDFKNFRNRQTDGTLLNVRERLTGADGKEALGPKQTLYVQKLGTGGDKTFHASAEKADLIVSSHPEVLSDADRSKHVFPNAEGKVWLALSGNGGKGSTLRMAAGDVQLGQWRKEGFVDPIRLDNGNVSLSVMAPLVVGDPHDPDGKASDAAKKDSDRAWGELDRQLGEAKKLGVDAVSTDVWWGLIEPKKGEFNWDYYAKLSEHIKLAGLKWVPILSFHQCGGNVGDDVNVPLPPWIWADVASRATNGDVEGVKYKSEQGHTSPEYVSLFADHAVMENYANVMRKFQERFASQAGNIGEINISLGPAGELRYPSYNAHDNNTGYPTRGALQSYSDLAIASFRKYVLDLYGSYEGVGKAWGIENLDESHILPPSDVTAFFGRGDHFNTQYGRDNIDWYNKSLVGHGQDVLSTAVSVFGQRESPFYGIDLGAKIPGVAWRVGERQGDNVILGDRLAEVTAGLIRTSRGDWDRDYDGRGYRPLFSMFKSMQPIVAGIGNRVVPYFTCLEMPDGDGGPSVKALPHTLATWAGQETERQGLWLKGENALNGNLYNNQSWDLMRGFLTLPNQHGYYHGLTFLRINDIVNNDTARNRISELNQARSALQVVRQSIRQLFSWAA